ncbi:hypothetical protein OEZ86_005522 [Tetradesmus obliquus]|nr:hypothetical protein OEZ86_005522 [Tetradesmus obliquus]
MTQPLSGIGHAGLPLYTKQQIAESASIREGLEPYREAQWRRQYTHFIIDLGKALGVPQWAIYTAVFICHHYFIKRSMQKNDRYLVATACLYLASKVQETPKYLRDVIKEAERRKWAKWVQQHPADRGLWESQANLEKMRDEVLVAERAVLYAISFQLRIKVPYNDLLLLQQHLPEAHRHDVINVAWNLVNDSLQTTLSLLWPPEKIAAAALFLSLQMHGLPLPSKEGRGFCALCNITDEELREISNGLLDVYVTVLCKESVPGTPPDRAQPSSPNADGTHLQLQENRVRLVMQQQHVQNQQQQQQQQQRSGGPTTPSEEQQQAQQEQPNGSMQHNPS